ncbi:sodium:proton exchanger [Erythrobacter sp. 3-20A1M]|uniref:cation:proton antiporter domain-containing protein n=1 Tax=Erythrobacter sp. 3-20A1M TaxID=2653850 RepID=UPI001BFC3904|nr:cation:proton antiporter [Erythrobacter sp. 3-20A1M]QWC57214.1 sodium:proton exchanger [Erythrobacter sp. 3-20A1M]
MEHGEQSMLASGLVLLAAALVFVLLFRKLGLGATLGYLVAGAVVGPQMLGLAGDGEDMIGFAELGIVLLLFIVGLELEPKRLWRMKEAIFGLGLAQVALCGAALVAVIWLAAAYPLTAAIALGLPLGLSSTAQVLPMLQSAGRLRTPFGERAFAILLFQDLSIIPLITIVAALGAQGAETGPPGWLLAVESVVAIAVLILAGRYLLRPLFRLIGRLGEREMFVVAGLFTVVAAAAIMEALGLSAALGAFVAGVMLASTPYRHELEADIEPFRSILLGLFFLSIGMMLDLAAIARQPLFVVAMALALVTAKTAIITAIGLVLKMRWRSALALGLLLSQGGEFAFVLFTQARTGGVIDADTASLFGAIVTLSMATTPFLMMVTAPLRRAGADERTREGPSADGARALVIGFGRFGQTVAQMLLLGGIRVSLIDRQVDQIDVAEEFGHRVFFGDGLRMDLLRQAGADEAALICFCIDGDQLQPDFLASVKEAFPDAAIMVRAFDRRTLIRLAPVEMAHVEREVREGSIAMGRAALDCVGLGGEQIDQLVQTFRENDAARLAAQIDAGDLHAGNERTLRVTAPE